MPLRPVRRWAYESPLGPKPVERWMTMLPDEVGRILGIELDLVAPSTLRSSGACPSAQIGEASEVGGSGVIRTSSTLFG